MLKGKTRQIQTLTLLKAHRHGWRLPHPHPALPPQRVQGEEAREGEGGRPRLVNADRARLDLAGGEHHKVAEGPAAGVSGGKGGPHLIEKGGEGITLYNEWRSQIDPPFYKEGKIYCPAGQWGVVIADGGTTTVGVPLQHYIRGLQGWFGRYFLAKRTVVVPSTANFFLIFFEYFF